MAHIYKKGRDWFLDYRYPPTRTGKRVREKVGPVKEEAQIVLSKRLEDMRQGRSPELRRIKPVLFEQVIVEFLGEYVGVAVEVRKEDGAVRVVKKADQPVGAQKKDADGFLHNVNVLLEHFEGLTLQSITPRVISDFINARLAEGVSKATTNRQRAVLSKVFNWAIDSDRCGGANPVRKVKRFAESPGRVRFLSREEAEGLVKGAPKHLTPILVAALHTGGRLSEVLGLRWEDVDLERGVLYFVQTNTKSGKQREIPIDADLAAVLSGLRKVRRISEPSPEYVFTRHGQPLHDIRTAFEVARERANLGPDVCFHTLRHSFASWFMINGGDLYRLQKYLGHSTVGMTQRYAHLSKEHLREGVRYFGAPAEAQTAAGGQSVDKPADPVASSGA